MNIVVVLGKVLNNDGSMSEELTKRCDLGIKTFLTTETTFLCLAGGIANPIAKVSEAEKMRQYCLSKGIEEKDIITEERSLTTYENARNLKRMLEDSEVDTIYLVSTKYHFFRTVFPTCQSLFRKFFPDATIINTFEE